MFFYGNMIRKGLEVALSTRVTHPEVLDEKGWEEIFPIADHLQEYSSNPDIQASVGRVLSRRTSLQDMFDILAKCGDKLEKKFIGDFLHFHGPHYVTFTDALRMPFFKNYDMNGARHRMRCMVSKRMDIAVLLHNRLENASMCIIKTDNFPKIRCRNCKTVRSRRNRYRKRREAGLKRAEEIRNGRVASQMRADEITAYYAALNS